MYLATKYLEQSSPFALHSMGWGWHTFNNSVVASNNTWIGTRNFEVHLFALKADQMWCLGFKRELFGVRV